MWRSLQSLILSRNASENATAPPKTTILCNKCQSISFLRSNKELYRRSSAHSRYCYQHHSSPSQLEASAREGCEFCAMLFHGLVTRYTRNYPDSELALFHDGWNESPVFLTPVLGGSETYTPGMELRGLCWDGKRYREATFVLVDLAEKYAILGDPTAEDYNTGSPASMELANIWLATCLKDHAECRLTATDFTSFFPKRVIDVSPFNGSNDVRLFTYAVRTSEATAFAQPYVTLSHCWGTHQIITTTTDSIERHHRRIEWQKLSKTFQEAITTTRSLGFQYIWIDSLCIIQDSVGDWETESAVMGEIYRRSILTISAAKAGNGSDGCFVMRDGKSIRPVQLPAYFGDQIAGKRGRTECKLQAPANSQRVWAATTNINFASGPLYNRAWVYQEQALARRSLVFGEECMYWECPSLVASESEPMGSMHRFDGLQLPLLEFGKLLNSLTRGVAVTNQSGVASGSLRDFWYTHVGAYSGRALTRLTDRLPALSGLAFKISEVFDDNTYAAGLWAADLVRGLLWTRGNDGLPGSGLAARIRPPMVFVGPSWSCVSMTGCHTTYDLMWRETRSPSAVLDDGLNIVAVNSELKSSNPFGEVLASTITLTGRLVHINVLKQGRAYILLDEGNNVGEVDLDDKEVLSGSI
ncbi:HET-domain-containing protein [Stipitochalara longipes BDJ]|nr:HET-domain-containing protein [Stipitochalara longipes BDJ]